MHPEKATITLLLVCLIIALPTLSEGRVTGICSDCHTMHFSQDGDSSAFDVTSPQQSLLNTTCIGCHSSTDDTTIDTSMGGATPIVFNNGTAPATPLSGGNFYWVKATDDRMGHNVIDTSAAADATLGVTPPGGTILDGTRMSCAGTTGCHGDRTIVGSGKSGGSDTAAISGAHHTAGTTVDGSTVGKSYRFLYGITGTEDSDWEYTKSSTDHNVYQGANRSDDDSTLSAAEQTTVSSLCAQCHTNFHNGDTDPVDGSVWGTPWVRHPTDFDMSTDLNSPNIEYPTTYNTDIPIAYSDVSTKTDEIVMCISCHRAHGSPNESILRWDYRGWPADTSFTNGCSICHTDKD